jgi:hypothetical protein
MIRGLAKTLTDVQLNAVMSRTNELCARGLREEQ